MRRRNRKGRQMTALEASQRAVMFMLESMGGAPAKRKRRNRGAARRAKIAARAASYRPYTDDKSRALALAAQFNAI